MWEADICSKEVQHRTEDLETNQLEREILWVCPSGRQGKSQKPEKAFSGPSPSQGTFEPKILRKCTSLFKRRERQLLAY